MYTVYALVDPRDDTTRYIGITDDVYRRFVQHIRCEGNNLHKNAWIEELKAANLMLIMKTIEVVETLEEAKEREVYWIKRHSAKGQVLFNITGAKASFTYDDFLAAMGTNRREEEEVLPIMSPSKNGKYKMDLDEAANYTGYSISTLQKLVRSGQIKTSSNGKLLVSSLKVRKQRSRAG